jgi:transporter family-2 protein
MYAILLVILISLAGGVAVGLQGPLSSLMSQRIGAMESIFIVHFGGAVAALLPLLVIGGGNLGNWRSVPWYALLAGTLGLVVIGAVSYAIPRVGVATTIILIVAGQLTIGAWLDHFGLLGAAVRPFDLSRLAGIFVLSVGVWLMVR